MSEGAQLHRRLIRRLEEEPLVAGIGLLGISLGAVCATIGLLLGFEVPPEGNLWETATFNAAVGIFHVTQAALLPDAGFTDRGRRRWSWALVLTTSYAYGIETIQGFRGLDPRISAVGGPADQILGGVFFLDALVIMLLFMLLAARFLRPPATPLRLAVRYASAACFVSFGVGIWMSTFQIGRVVEPMGNLLPIHAVGFHALQAVPLVALLFAWGGVRETVIKLRVHVAGIVWLGLCAAVLWQAATGAPPLEPSPANLIALFMLVAWAVVAGGGLRAWAKRAPA